jgi:hypothetical protein
MYIHTIAKSLALTLCAVMALPAAAAPRLISADALKAGKTTFSLFYVDLTKVLLSKAVSAATLQARLDTAGEGLTACLLAGDVNANNINCGNGLMQLGADFFSTTTGSNHAAPIINWLPEDKDSGLDKSTVEFGVNSRTNTVLNGPFETPRVFHIRFNKPIAQFGFLIDPFLVADPTTPLTEGRLLDGLQFIVNGQNTPVHSFASALRGDIPFVGVEDLNGFTEVTVIGTALGSVKPDRYTIVPLTNF